jgi:hypothetical protein
MYKIIGADGAEYGPATADQIRLWIAEGRANAHTKVQVVGATDWVELGSLPEFADALLTKPPRTEPSRPRPPTQPVEVPLDRDYVLKIDECISRGWELLQKNFSILFVASLIYLLIEFLIGLLGSIPFVGPVFSVANAIIVGPLLGGLFWVFIQVNRGKPARPGDVFAGFGKPFLNLLLGQIVPSLLAALCMLPAVIVGLVTLLPSIFKNQEPTPAMFIPTICVALLCVVPMIWLNVNWVFTLPLVIDKGIDFWTAMRASWRMVHKHWWRVFAVLLLVGIFNALGILLCCVGVLFSVPISLGMIVHTYETMFGLETSGGQAHA